MTQEQIFAMALTNIQGINTIQAKRLYEAFGSATALFENRNDLKSYIPDVSPRLQEIMKDVSLPIKRAEDEMNFISKKKISLLMHNDDAYPQRLKNCDDAPIVLYYCGNADLNKAKIISMVGTRKCNEYGKDICRNFVADLKAYNPDILVVSGLAYGIDIHSHRAALANDMETVGVLAHGLDRIYPSVHRQTAVDMVSHGGLLTEYMSGTSPERYNFLSRNRIIAGICDACLVVQSANKGGSLVTADLAQAYNRDVFTFPGRIYDEYSAGCNRLIKENKAIIITSAEDFIGCMGWGKPAERDKLPYQQELFTTLSPEEELIVKSLQNVENKVINEISNETGLSCSSISSIMFELELKGIVKVLGGARYRLIK